MPTSSSSGAYRGDPSLSEAIAKLQEDVRQLRARSVQPDKVQLLVKVQPDEPPGPTGTAWLDTDAAAP